MTAPHEIPAVRTLMDMLAIPSLSGEEARLAEYIQGRLAAFGIDAVTDEHANVFAVVGGGGKTCHINGHTDTIAPVPGWQRDPFTPGIEDDRIYGLGASDMQAGLAVMVELAGRLARKPPGVRVVFSFTICEEGAAEGKVNGVKTLLEGDLGTGEWMISTEPTVDGGGSTISVGCQGHVHVNIACRGEPAHSAYPEQGVNAISTAAEVARRVEQLNDSYKRVAAGRGQYGRPSVAVTTIHGGAAHNVIPAACALHVSRRITPGESLATVRAEFDELLAGLEASFRLSGGTPAIRTDEEGPLLAAVEAVYDAAGMEKRYSFLRGRADSVLFAEKGMDCIGIGPGLGDQAHRPDEHCRAQDLATCLELLEATLRRLRSV